VCDAGRKGGTDDKIPGRNDFHGITGQAVPVNTLRTGDADLRFYIATVQDG